MEENYFERFKLLNNHLLLILTTNNHQNENLSNKIHQYISLIVESTKHSKRDEIFDYFCENQGIKILKLVLEVDPLLAIKSFSLLFVNLKQELWINYILCQPFLTEAIEAKPQEEDEEWTEYFISFLKSLSIRVNAHQISLFYNKKSSKFPLIYEAIKYFNHPDCMVRTNIMNIILEIMKLKDLQVHEYFSRFPFFTYILTFCCEINQHITNFNNKTLALEHPQKKNCKSYCVDLSDFLYYINDLLNFGSDHLIYLLENAVLSYLVLPALKIIESSNEHEVKHAIFLMFQFLKVIKSQRIAQIIVIILLGKYSSMQICTRVRGEAVYIPHVFESKFDPTNFYWEQYSYQVTAYCLGVFKDVNNFDVEHESAVKDELKEQEFNEEISKISFFLGFDILTFEPKEHQPLTEILKNYENWTIENPFRIKLLDLFEKSQDQQLNILITSILLEVSKNDLIQNNILSFATALFPSNDILYFKEHTNLEGILKIKSIILCKFKKIDISNYRLAYFKNLIALLRMILVDQMSEEEETILVDMFRHLIQNLKEQIKVEHMELIVQNFEAEYTKWYNHSDKIDADIPYCIFVNTAEEFAEVNQNFTLASSKNTLILNIIRLYALVRSFYVEYFLKFHQFQFDNFSQIYQEKFTKITNQWRVGKSYKNLNKNMKSCNFFKGTYKIQEKKSIFQAIIIDDDKNLVVVEPKEDEAIILVNCPWKNVDYSIAKADANIIQVKIHLQPNHDIHFALIFQDQVRSTLTSSWMKEAKKNRFLEEQAFILNFLINTTEE